MKTHDTDADREAKRLVDLLAGLIRLSGRSLRSIEADLGMGSSVLSKILSGVIRPQLSYVLLICSAIDVAPSQFVRLAYPAAGPASPLVEKYREALGLPPEEEGVPDDFDRRVRESLLRLLDELRRTEG